MTNLSANAGTPELLELLAARVKGEVDSSSRRRAEYSTDASLYRILPQAVVFPRDAADVEAALAVARETGVPLTSRGAGTSIAGNAIGPGIVLDFSRHMNRILEIDPETRTARVQPGVVMSELQKTAAPHGLRFGPDPSTQNRATFGGMIGNNACGAHAVAYGRTSDNVISLTVLLADGRIIDTADGTAQIDGLDAFADAHLAAIRTRMGTFKRQVSGYALEHLLPENGRDLAKFLVGSEGTLAIILEATVRLVPVPASPALVVLGYESMAAAADDVPEILKHEPLAVEGMNDVLVDVVRRHKGSVPALPEGAGWLFIEIGARDGEDAAAVLARAEALAAAANTDAVRICEAGPDATELWRIRADGAGLGGRTAADHQAWPGWEDSAVPPEKLGAYLRDLRALLDAHGLDGLMYGHFGDGCVHIRIDFPLDSAAGIPSYRSFMEAGADLVARYGGSLSGEHGDGRCRSELMPRMYPAEIIEAFAQAKALFDPKGILNPGVLVEPDAIDEHLRRPYAKPVPHAGGFHFHEDGGDMTRAVHRCTGVGNCRADRFGQGFFLCPSYDASRDEKDATRGRVRVLEELVRGELFDSWDAPEVLESLDLCLACKACSADCPTGIDVARYRSETLYRAYKGKIRPRTHYTLGNLPVLARMATKVPLVAAAANAFMKVGPARRLAFMAAGLDPRRTSPKFATKVLSRFDEFRDAGSTEDVRPGIEGWGSPEAPGSGGIGASVVQVDAKRDAVRDAVREDAVPGTPAVAGGSGDSGAARDVSSGVAPEASREPAPMLAGHRYVVLWADSFSHTLDARGARAAIGLLQRAGYEVLVPPSDTCCGLTWITTGQLGTAKKKLERLLGRLGPFAANGVPIVGVEPSCTAVLRSDLEDLLPDDPRTKLVKNMTYTLAELLSAPAPVGPGEELALPDLTGINIVAQPHCHHYSVMGWKADEELIRRTGATLTKVSGCCGLAGNFGMEAGHYEMSVKIGEKRLLPALREAPEDAVYLADGFSCRTQADQLAGVGGIHLAELLLRGRAVL